MRPKERHKTKPWEVLCKCDRPMYRIAHNVVVVRPVFVCGRCGRGFDGTTKGFIRQSVTNYLLTVDARRAHSIGPIRTKL